MRDVKRVLEMRAQNHSQRNIADALKISRDTVRRIFNAADSKKICWSSIQDLNEFDAQSLLFEEEVKIILSIKIPRLLVFLTRIYFFISSETLF